MAYDVEGQIGAGRDERNEERTTQRNGYRLRAFDTRLGRRDLKLPKLRKGSDFPGFLEPRRRYSCGDLGGELGPAPVMVRPAGCRDVVRL